MTMDREIITKWIIKDKKIFEAKGHLSRAGNTFFIEHAEPKEKWDGKLPVYSSNSLPFIKEVK